MMDYGLMIILVHHLNDILTNWLHVFVKFPA